MNISRSDGRVDFRSLIDCLEASAVWIVSDLGEFEYVSAGAEDLWGVSADSLQRNPSLLIDAIHPDDRDRILSRMENSGEEVSERSYVARTLHPDGTVKWVSTRQVPVRGDDGDLLYVVGLCTDITEQKRREQELEALNRILRHDIRNDLSVILGWGELLEEHLDERGQEYLDKILAASNNIVDLTEVARDYAKSVAEGDDMDVRSVSLRDVLREEIDVRRETFPNAEFLLVGDVPDIDVQANELLPSVFQNLLNNAVQHNDKREPRVKTSVTPLGDDVIVRVMDNGPGIPEEVQESLFTDGEKGVDSSGTGMGLYLVQTLVDQYGGEIDVMDNTPTGTVFQITLPKVV